MGSRRDFLQLGIAATTLPLLQTSLSSSPSLAPSAPASLPLYKAVFDQRFPDSVSFATRLATLGVAVHGIEGDVTGFWFHELHPRWSQEPVAVAGLTLHGPLFCLERLAWDHRMRVVYRAEHRLRSDGRIAHALAGPESMVKEAANLLGAGSDWSARVANVVSRCPWNCSPKTETTIIAPLSSSFRAAESTGDERDPLISWVIAPVARA